MTIDEKKRQLALNRLQQADESLDEARYLFDGNKSARAINKPNILCNVLCDFSTFDF